MQEHARILGLDVGDRRIGIAMTDALGNARPLITMGRSTPKQELKDFQRLVRKHSITEIVAGNPFNMDGTVSEQTLKAQAYAAWLQEQLGLPVHLADERLSSAEAEAWLDRHGYARGPERKGLLDRVAAMILLQDWLDARALRANAEALRAESSQA